MDAVRRAPDRPPWWPRPPTRLPHRWAQARPPRWAAPGAPERELTPEEQAATEAYASQLDEARQQLLEAPAGLVIGQQALQFYEVAALHRSQPEPKLEEARIAIDALAAVVDALGERLGEAETPLRQAVHQLRLAFVEASRAPGAEPTADDPPVAPALGPRSCTPPTRPGHSDRRRRRARPGGARHSRPGARRTRTATRRRASTSRSSATRSSSSRSSRSGPTPTRRV